MDVLSLLGIVLVFLVLKANKTTAACQPKRKEFGLEFTNKTLIGRLLGSPVAMEEIACQFSCHANDFCDAYNFNTKTDQCELLDGKASVKMETRQEWKCRVQKCEKGPCINGGACFYFHWRANCVCDPCTWKGDFCQTPVTNSDIVMSFPGGSVNDLVILKTPFSSFASLSQLTVSMWFQIDPAKVEVHALFCYATLSLNDVIAVMVKSDRTLIAINRKWSDGQFSDPSQWITDNGWHHFLFTWENVNGKLVLYIDGIKRGEKSNVAIGETIDQSGGLVLGQDQDRYLGGYDPQQALKGNITSLNMWDKVLTASEISDLASKCPTQEGNILTWSVLMSQSRSGDVKLICSPLCVP